MTRADEPTQEGTPLNKASLLTDAVATAFGLGGSAVPNDVLDILKKSVLAQVTGKYTKHTTIGELPVGKTVLFNVNGVATEFLKVQQGKPSSIYDDSCDGTWMLQLKGLPNSQWATSRNDYKNSTINEYLNGDYLKSLDAETRAAIKQVKIPYWDGTGLGGTAQNGANGLSCKVFILSLNEVGFDFANAVDTGSKLDYFLVGDDSPARGNRGCLGDTGSLVVWSLRSPYPNDIAKVYFVNTDGGYVLMRADSTPSHRPAFILPSEYAYTFYTDEGGNVYTEQEYTTILTDVLGNEINTGAMVEVGSYVGTGTYGESGKNSLAFGFNPKVLIIEPRYSLTATPTRGVAVLPLLQDDTLLPWFRTDSGFSVATSSWSGSSTIWAAVRVTKTGNIVQWYNPSNNTELQLNKTNTVYDYIAIG